MAYEIAINTLNAAKTDGSLNTKSATDIQLEDVRIYLRGGDKKNVRLHVDNHFFGEFNKDLVKWKKTDQLTKYKNELKKINTAYSADSGLEKRLAQLKASGNDMEVAIDADPDVPYIFVIKAIDACNALNISNLKFTGAKKRLGKQNEGVIR